MVLGAFGDWWLVAGDPWHVLAIADPHMISYHLPQFFGTNSTSLYGSYGVLENEKGSWLGLQKGMTVEFYPVLWITWIGYPIVQWETLFLCPFITLLWRSMHWFHFNWNLFFFAWKDTKPETPHFYSASPTRLTEADGGSLPDQRFVVVGGGMVTDFPATSCSLKHFTTLTINMLPFMQKSKTY